MTCEACDCRRAGYKALLQRQQQRGPDFAQAARQKSYQLAPRATLFRRDAGTVDGLASLKRLMRSNSYSTDPVSPASTSMLFPINPVGPYRHPLPLSSGHTGTMCSDTRMLETNVPEQHMCSGSSALTV